MQVRIRQIHQRGDRNIRLISSVLNILLTLFLMAFLFQIIIATLIFDWFVEGSELSIFLNLLLIILTALAIYSLRRIYFKIIFNDRTLTICSRFKLFNRQIRYDEILTILVDEKSNKRRIETKNEYFEIDNADIISLTLISQEKHINLKRINVE